MPDIQVTNRNDFPLTGRFAGKDYKFPPGEPVEVPEKAATHIFALGEENKTGALNRLGLLYPARPDRPGRSLEEAFKVLDKVTFAQGRIVFDEPESLPPPEEKPIGDSPGAPRNPGGESGAETSSPVSAADALAREVLARRKRHGAPSGG